MVKAKKICKVCGKEYEACHTLAFNEDVFRWQDVACSEECGATYLARVLEARGLAPKSEVAVKQAEPRKRKQKQELAEVVQEPEVVSEE